MPEGWVWTTLGSVCSIKGGKRIPKGKTFSKDKTAHVYIRVTDMKNGSVDMADLKYIDEDVYEEIRRYTIEKDDLYLTIAGTIGKVGEIPDALHGMNLTENAARLTEIVCDKRYLMYSLMTDLAQNHFSLRFHQVAQPKLSIETSSSTLIAMPPLAEQKRIVRAIENIFNCFRLLDLNLAALEGDVINAKKLILDLAIHGKLVPQDPADEPASELLRRINPAFKPSDNLHYEGAIPAGWQLTKMGDLVDIISGTSYKKRDIVNTGNGIRVLRGGNIQNGGILLYDDDVFIDASLTNESNTIHKGDIAIVASTGSSELIGKAAIATRDYPRTQIGAFLRIARPKSILLSEYIGVIFQSDYYKSHIKKTAKGTNINNIKTSYLTDFIIPFPPREEQERIICKIRDLMSFLNQITNSVNCTE